jgi:hypothetical protein
LQATSFDILKAKPSFHEALGGSGRLVHRCFCGKCGGFITAYWPANPHLVPSAFQPATEIWLAEAKPWHPVQLNTTKFDGAPLTGVVDKLDAYFAKRVSSRAAMS